MTREQATAPLTPDALETHLRKEGFRLVGPGEWFHQDTTILVCITEDGYTAELDDPKKERRQYSFESLGQFYTIFRRLAAKRIGAGR
jgi:hypothetical protein